MNTMLIGCTLFLGAILSGILLSPNRTEFFLAGKTASGITVGTSLFATCVGASAMAGLVARAYSIGWAAFWWLGAGSLGLILLGVLWVGPMRAVPTTQTLPQWLGHNYGLPARIMAAVLIDIMWVAVIAAQWVAAGSLLSGILSWSVGTGIAVSAAAATAYTAWGGQRSVLRTDFWQTAMIIAAISIPLCFLRGTADPLNGTGPVLSLPGLFEGLSFLQWFALLVTVGGMYVVGPDLCSRVLIAKNDASARKAAICTGIALLPCSLAITAVGVAIGNSGIKLENSRDAFSWLITQSGILPSWATGLVGFGFLAAILSSADTCLLTAASVFELDLAGRSRDPSQHSGYGRGAVLVTGLLSAALARMHPSIIPNMLLAYCFYTGGLLTPLLMLAFPQTAKQIKRPWVWTGMTVGGTLPVLLLVTGTTADSAVAGLTGVTACSAAMLIGFFYQGIKGEIPATTKKESSADAS